MKEILINSAEEKDEWYLMKAGVDKYECPKPQKFPSMEGWALQRPWPAWVQSQRQMRRLGLRGWE